MLKSKKFFVFITIFLLLIMGYLYVSNIKSVSTDQVGLIEQYLTEVLKEKQNIEVVDSEVVLDYEIVGFRYGEYNQYGFALFERENSYYDLKKCYLQQRMIKRAADIYIKYIDLSDGQRSVSHMVVLNLNNRLVRIDFVVDGNKPKVVEINPAPSVSVIETPTSSFEYLFYDAFNTRIE